MKMKMTTVLLFVLSFGTGQTAFSQYYKAASDIKWTGKDTGISNLIDNSGYYTNGKSYISFVFYNDGTLVTCRAPSDTTNHFLMLWPPRAYFHKNCWRGGSTGVFRIEENMIYANTYFCDYLFFKEVYGVISTLKFRVIDRQTVVWLSKITRDWDGDLLLKETEINDTLFLERNDNLPPPNTKWKRKRWLWENVKEMKQSACKTGKQ